MTTDLDEMREWLCADDSCACVRAPKTKPCQFHAGDDEVLELRQRAINLVGEVERLRSRPTHPPDGAIDYPRMICEQSAKLAQLKAENERLREALGKVVPNCEWLHHTKQDCHHATEECPVERQIRRARGESE